jgi:hypothetical protein
VKNTVIVCSTNRAVQDQTRQAIEYLCSQGAELIWQTGSADVAFARNVALTGALRCVATHNKVRPEPIDVVLMVDDDMTFTLEQAQELVTHARETGVAVSAMYATLMGTLAATRLYTPPGEPQRWLAGLGLLAIPFPLLQELARRSEIFQSHGEERIEFTWAAAHNGEWFAEDYVLCRRLGGVHLLPMGVGHLKVIPVYPDAETIGRIARGERLPGDTDLKLLSRVEDPVMLAGLTKKGESLGIVAGDPSVMMPAPMRAPPLLAAPAEKKKK